MDILEEADLIEAVDYEIIPETSDCTQGWYLLPAGEKKLRAFCRKKFPMRRPSFKLLGLDEW